MRITAGKYRNRQLVVPATGLRPTTDMTRQALFNILGVVDGLRFADLCAGSGAVGLDAISRGVGSVVFVEQDRAAVGSRGGWPGWGCRAGDRERARAPGRPPGDPGRSGGGTGSRRHRGPAGPGSGRTAAHRAAGGLRLRAARSLVPRRRATPPRPLARGRARGRGWSGDDRVRLAADSCRAVRRGSAASSPTPFSRPGCWC